MPERCVVCGGERFIRTTGREDWSIQACARCETAFTFPPPASDRVYASHSFYSHSAKDVVRWRTYATDALDLIVECGGRGALLDVGCGGGLLIEQALKRGFQAQGIDASHSAVLHARSRGLVVTEGYFQDDAGTRGSFDIIVMSHVLEHVLEPASLLTAARAALKPDGLLFLAQTNYLGTVPRLLGARWYAWVPTEHVTHFSPQGLRYLLGRTGFHEFMTKYTTLEWSWVTPVSLVPKQIAGMFLHNLAVLISRGRVGLPFVGDQVFVVARPSEEV